MYVCVRIRIHMSVLVCASVFECSHTRGTHTHIFRPQPPAMQTLQMPTKEHTRKKRKITPTFSNLQQFRVRLAPSPSPRYPPLRHIVEASYSKAKWYICGRQECNIFKMLCFQDGYIYGPRRSRGEGVKKRRAGY